MSNQSKHTHSTPDTLDLSEIARRAVRGIEGMSDPNAMDEQYWLGGFDRKGVCMLHDVNDWCESKWLGPLALLRQISGEGSIASDAKRMARLAGMAHPGGGFYEDVGSRPWSTDFGQGGDMYATETGKRFMMAGMNGRYAEAALMYWKLTGDDQWRKHALAAIHKCGDLMTLRNRANKGEEYAYFRQSSIFPEGSGDQSNAPEPPREINHCGVWTGQGALTAYRLTGDSRCLDIAIPLARYLLNQSKLVENDGSFGISHFYGGIPCVHFHLNALVRCFLLDLGLEINEPTMIQAGETAWFWGWHHGEPTMGFFPEWLQHGVSKSTTTCEICCVADMIHLGLLLSNSGRKDCWDDIDRWVRNMFVEGQIKEHQWMHHYWERVMKDQPSRFEDTTFKTYERAAERMIGTWAGWIAPNQLKQPGMHHGPDCMVVMNCCTGNASAQLYRVWRDMAVFNSNTNTLRVNLLLNKSMPEAEIRSWLPHQGKVEVEIKGPDCRNLALRIPGWVDRSRLTCRRTRVSGDGKSQRIEPRFEGKTKYLVCENVAPGEMITIEFPVEEQKQTLHIMGRDWPVVIRGSTIVDIQPGGEFGSIFNRPELRSDTAPLVTREPQAEHHEPITW